MTKPVVVTRAEPPDGPLSRELGALGLPVLLWPAIGIEPVASAELTRALQHLPPLDWIVFSSGHAVVAITQAWPRPPQGVHIAAVGPATAAALRARGWPVDLSGQQAGADELLRAFARWDLRGRRILHPAGSRALPTLRAGLAALGADVIRIEAYRTVPGVAFDVEACRETVERRDIGAVTFASPSAVVEMEHALGAESFLRLLQAAPVVAIGPTTADALSQRGCTPIVARPHTLHALAANCQALLRGAAQQPHANGGAGR